jgi:uncharacterized Zn-binding protein involved in type VI secretion
MPIAARAGDSTSHPGFIVRPGVPTVLIRMPAARLGDAAGSGAPITTSRLTVTTGI